MLYRVPHLFCNFFWHYQLSEFVNKYIKKLKILKFPVADLPFPSKYMSIMKLADYFLGSFSLLSLQDKVWPPFPGYLTLSYIFLITMAFDLKEKWKYHKFCNSLYWDLFPDNTLPSVYLLSKHISMSEFSISSPVILSQWT